MARLTALPSVDIIRGFKGVIDFYLWKGLPCVRKWPYTPPRRRTAATIAAAALFGDILKSYRLLADNVLEAYRETAAGTPRTARDVFTSSVLGYLHEASMSDFLNLLTNCRDSLLALEALLGALGSEDTDDLQVDVKTSALPAGAATLAEQQTQTTALQVIDNLSDALQSVATDQLQVRGEDQLFSFKGVLCSYRTAKISGADGYIDSNPVPAGEIWCVTSIGANDIDTATTRHRYLLSHPPAATRFYKVDAVIAATDYTYWGGWIWLDPGDTIRVNFIGGLVNDDCAVALTGHIMTLET